MEVMDSHMSEHFSAQAPTHIDVDMSAEYDDDAEYAMHDVTEATTTTNDEEIYDAEFEEVPEHTEIEMDEYADEVEVVEVEDDETHMGSYVPTDDGATVTDVTVEDVQLLSSPVPAGIPQAATMHPISPHVSVDAVLPINEAPSEALASHSPRSVATLVGDSDTEHLQADASKDGDLNEVIDLTENDEQPQIVSVDVVEETSTVDPVDPINQAFPQTEHEVNQDVLDEVDQGFYEAEEPTTEHLSTDPTAPDQPVEQQEDEQNHGKTDQNEQPPEVPASLEIPEQVEQDEHSPIEEALVINQQVRDDAADSMEPSPPIRLYYRDESKGVDEIFDVFASTGLNSHETVLLFDDNRTLFYEPLSAFFTKLRETVHFSGDEWENAEIGLRMDLGDSGITINEDHKETENVSLFKLSSIWTGFGLEEPLEFTLVRRSERFVIQLARLVEQVEHRDFHNEDVMEAPEVQHGVETGAPEINSGDIEDNNSDTVPLESNDPEDEHTTQADPDETPADPPRDLHESDDTHAAEAAQSEQLDERRHGLGGVDVIRTTEWDHVDKGPEETAQDIPTITTQDPTTQPTHVDTQGSEAEVTGPSPQDDDGNTVSSGQSPNTPTPKPQDDDYDEYAEGGNDLAPTQTSVQDGASEYDYDEDYEGADEEHGQRTPPHDLADESTATDHTPPNPSVAKESLQNLKRNLDDVEYEEYETPSAPSSPASASNKRVKHHT